MMPGIDVMSLLSRTTLCSAFLILSACRTAGDTGVSASTPPAQRAVEAGAVAQADSSAPDVAEHSARLNAFFEQVFQDRLSRRPMMQARLGIKDRYDEWDDLSDSASVLELERTKASLAQMRNEFAGARLDEQARLSYRLFEYSAQRAIDSEPWRHHSYPITHMSGIHSEVPSFLINVHRVSSESDARAYIARLAKVDRMFAQVIQKIEMRAARGIIPPAFVFPKVIEQVGNVISGAPFDDSGKDSTLLADFKAKVEGLATLDPKTRAALLREAEAALLSSVGPAYRELARVLEAQAASASTDDGAWKFPNGSQFYAHALARTTTTAMTAKEIHELGLAEVDRIHDEMRAIMKQVGFKGDLQAFFEFMRNDPRFYEPNTPEGRENYLDRATKVIDDMRAKLDGLFLTKPKAPIVVKAVEAFREKNAGKAFYNRGTPDGSRPGTFYANLYDMKDMATYQLEALAYHEGIPGHHMQISIAQELEDIPKFRRFSGYTAYVEGWGLYSELLPKEYGAYADPYSDFGRLAMELWRACRLVLDTGIHGYKWTRSQANDYLRANTPSAPREAQAAIDRYIVWPSQATAYKIGMNHILALRAAAKSSLGERFDIREFHDVVLTSGPLPLDILSERVEQWVARKSAGPQALVSSH